MPFHLKATERMLPRVTRRVARRLRVLTLSVTRLDPTRALRGLTGTSRGEPKQVTGEVGAVAGTGVVTGLSVVVAGSGVVVPGSGGVTGGLARTGSVASEMTLTDPLALLAVSWTWIE